MKESRAKMGYSKWLTPIKVWCGFHMDVPIRKRLENYEQVVCLPLNEYNWMVTTIRNLKEQLQQKTEKPTTGPCVGVDQAAQQPKPSM